MDKAVIRGTFSDYKLIKTRKVVQIIVEVPVEQQAQVFAALGFPMPDSETWVAVARLDPEAAKRSPAAPEKVRKRFHKMPLSQQAALRCQDEKFQDWLETQGLADREMVVPFVRSICYVKSRSELDSNEDAGELWETLNARYEAWAGLTAEAR